jgi:hypothetical protein
MDRNFINFACFYKIFKYNKEKSMKVYHETTFIYYTEATERCPMD